jgi:hypothetical protein
LIKSQAFWMISRIPKSREVPSGILHNWPFARELRQDFGSVSFQETMDGGRAFIPCASPSDSHADGKIFAALNRNGGAVQDGADGAPLA